MDLTVDIGLEKIQRALVAFMVDNINTAIDAQNTYWTTRDTDFFTKVGRTMPDDYAVEHIAADNIYSGTIPSLITSPASFFPNLSVIAYIGNPIGTNDDWMEHYVLTVNLEFMVKSLKSEELVNSRIDRTLEAAHSVLTSDYARTIPDLDGKSLVPRIGAMPTVTVSDVFVRHTTSDPNDRSFYQHGALTYRVDKFSGYSGG